MTTGQTEHRVGSAQWALKLLDGKEGIGRVIAMVETTAEGSWNQDTVRSTDGQRNCFFGHLFSWGESVSDEAGANRIWEAFEEIWSTTYVVYSVNDGTHPGYQEPTPRQRILSYLRNLRDGLEEDTRTSMDRNYRWTTQQMLVERIGREGAGLVIEMPNMHTVVIRIPGKVRLMYILDRTLDDIAAAAVMTLDGMFPQGHQTSAHMAGMRVDHLDAPQTEREPNDHRPRIHRPR